MSTVAHVIRQIRSLSYSDMMLIAGELQSRIGELTQNQIEAVVLADILSRLQAGETSPYDAAREEDKILRKIFSMKRNMTVSRHGVGWSIEVSTLNGLQVLGTDLRAMFPMILDQMITLHVLTQK